MLTTFPKQDTKIDRILLIANRSAGSWPGSETFDKLGSHVRDSLPNMEVQCSSADSHSAVASEVRGFLSSSAPSAIIVGGGGGTLRAAMEATISCESLRRTLFAPLRLGSGNVLARRLRVPKDSFVGVQRLCDGLLRGSFAPITIIRCTYEGRKQQGKRCSAHAVALVGLGQFGRVPGDLERHRWALQFVRPLARKFLGVESATNYEYGVALAIRTLTCITRPSFVELVEIHHGGITERFRLLGGAILTFPIPGIPCAPHAELFEEARVVLIPMQERVKLLRNGVHPDRMAELSRCYSITKDKPFIVRLLDREHAGFFLDEDPLQFTGSMQLDIAGVANFVRVDSMMASSTSERA